LSGAAFAWFASADPDGLEWSIAKVTGSEELAGSTAAAVHDAAAALQEKTAFLPGYDFKRSAVAEGAEPAAPAWPAVDAGTSVAGLVGGAITLVVAALIGLGLGVGRRARTRSGQS
jgi:cobalt/nickel transport system permease protein